MQQQKQSSTFPPFPPPFLFRRVSHSLALFRIFLSGLSSAAYVTAFLAKPAEENGFLALRVCGCLLFVCLSVVFVSCFYFVSYVAHFLATMFFAGHFSCPFFPLVCFPFSFFSDHVPGLIWFDSVDLVITAGFIAEQLVMRE